MSLKGCGGLGILLWFVSMMYFLVVISYLGPTSPPTSPIPTTPTSPPNQVFACHCLLLTIYDLQCTVCCLLETVY